MVPDLVDEYAAPESDHRRLGAVSSGGPPFTPERIVCRRESAREFGNANEDESQRTAESSWEILRPRLASRSVFPWRLQLRKSRSLRRVARFGRANR